jgi:ribonuclease P protein component
VTNGQFAPRTNGSSPERRLQFPKSRRLLRPPEFKKVYQEGIRISGPCFAAFCLASGDPAPARLGFTATRALGKSVKRNRMKRRVREALRLCLPQFGPGWQIVVNLRRAALDAPAAQIRAEVERLLARCKA